MSRIKLIVFLILGASGVLGEVTENSSSWSGFRGDGKSVTTFESFPLKWDESSVKGWEFDLEGKGQSSPVVFEDQVYVTAINGPAKETLLIYALDLDHGKVKWKGKEAASATRQVTEYISFAAPTPVVDQERVYAFYEEGDFLVWNHQGELVWRVSLSDLFGSPEGNHGQGSSPVLSQFGVVALVDQKGESFLICLNKENGQVVWKTIRESSTAWSTPALMDWNDQQLIVVSASGSVLVYNAKDGKEIARYADVLDGNNVPSPTVQGQSIAIASRKRGSNLLIEAKSKEGQLELVSKWEARKATSTFGSPLIHDNRVYYVSDAGIVFAYNAQTGEPLFEERIESSTWASPLGAPGRIYFFGSNGTTTVMATSDQPEVLSINSLPTQEKDKVYGYAVCEKGFIIRTANQVRTIFN